MMDRRIKNKTSLKPSFIYSSWWKTFQQITITDIVTVADVNRGTFYKHYRDKEELLDSIIDEVLADLQKAYQDPYTHKTPFSIQTLTPSMIKFWSCIRSSSFLYTSYKIDNPSQFSKSSLWRYSGTDFKWLWLFSWQFEYRALVTCILSSTCDFRHDCFLGRRKFCSFTGVYVRATSSYYSD